MQAAKKAVETIKETAANTGASAMSGLEKTKATIQEKTEKMSTSDHVQKDLATQKKEERINRAEMNKQKAREHNAAAKQSATVGHVTEGHYTPTGPQGQPMGATQMSAVPVHGHGLGHEELNDNVVASHSTGMGTTMAHNTHVGGIAPGSGPTFS